MYQIILFWNDTPQQNAYFKQIKLLLASGYEKELHLVSARKQTAVSVWQMPVAVCTVVNPWWWTERPSETCRVLFQNKIIWYIGASGWIYYRNTLRCTALWTSNLMVFFMFEPSTHETLKLRWPLPPYLTHRTRCKDDVILWPSLSSWCSPKYSICLMRIRTKSDLKFECFFLGDLRALWLNTYLIRSVRMTSHFSALVSQRRSKTFRKQFAAFS